MGQNKIAHGDNITLTAAEVLTGGSPKLVGGFFGVVQADAAIGDLYVLETEGIFSLTKSAASTNQDVAVGDYLYWDASASKVTPIANGSTPVGIATKLAASTATSVELKLLGEKQQFGKIVEVLAPSGGFTVNVPAIFGALFVIPLETKAEGLSCKVQLGGVATLTKVTIDTINAGQIVYWNTSSAKVTEVATAAWKIGAALAAADGSATTVLVTLNGTDITVEAG